MRRHARSSGARCRRGDRGAVGARPRGGRAEAGDPDRRRRRRLVRVGRRRADRGARLAAGRADRAARRHRLRERLGRRPLALLRAELGPLRPAHPGGAREPRLQHGHGRARDRLVPPPRERLVQLPARRLARRRAQLELRRGRRLRQGLAAVALAPGRPGREPGALHPRLLAPPALQLRRPRLGHRVRAPSGTCWRARRRTSCCRGTTTTTSASPR